MIRQRREVVVAADTVAVAVMFCATKPTTGAEESRVAVSLVERRARRIADRVASFDTIAVAEYAESDRFDGLEGYFPLGCRKDFVVVVVDVVVVEQDCDLNRIRSNWFGSRMSPSTNHSRTCSLRRRNRLRHGTWLDGWLSNDYGLLPVHAQSSALPSGRRFLVLFRPPFYVKREHKRNG